ncbi:MAG: hypothetical protein HY329_02230 [Chloroflexi bacterium]|nr:hypothetical protein [Chloroflexota bacterium]
MVRFDRCVVLTALVLPVGLANGGLPAGLQLVGPPFAEARRLTVGHALEAALALGLSRRIDPVQP